MASVRSATPEDAEAITQVHLSDVEHLYRWDADGTRHEVDGSVLTDRERFLNGGPWLLPSSCRTHLEQVLTADQWPLVVVEGREVLGEMEVIHGPDPLWGETAHIDVMVVRQGHRGRGLGRLLVEEGRRRARTHGCRMYTVNPETRAIPFYERCGFRDVVRRQRELTVKLSEGSALPGLRTEVLPEIAVEAAATLPLRLGFFQTGYDEWIRARWVDPEFHFPSVAEEGRLPEAGAYYRFLRNFRVDRGVFLQAWVPGGQSLAPVLLACAHRALRLGYAVLDTTVPSADLASLAPVGGGVGEESILLGTPLEGAPRGSPPPDR